MPPHKAEANLRMELFGNLERHGNAAGELHVALGVAHGGDGHSVVAAGGQRGGQRDHGHTHADPDGHAYADPDSYADAYAHAVQFRLYDQK